MEICVISSVKASTARSYGVNSGDSFQSGRENNRSEVSPFSNAALECIFTIDELSTLVTEMKILDDTFSYEISLTKCYGITRIEAKNGGCMTKNNRMGLGIALGAGLGVTFGEFLFDNHGMGIAIGAFIGILLAAILPSTSRTHKKK
ncbi:hypothetical protein [Vibrio sp. F74]|uniref:hypothetical protein n=1 Tax=Vibrio sp. F74 TaxID=700020 RepID=UPI0035F556C7